MALVRQVLHDFNRLTYHYDIVTLYSLFFQRVLPIIALGCIALGLLAAGFGLPDARGGPRRGLRRVALGGVFSLVGMALYVLVPIWLDSLGITPSQGHIRFYGMFFIPVGALAGVLAVLVGSWQVLAPSEAKRRGILFSVVGYVIGFVVLWLVFLLYSWLILGTTMVLFFALIRASLTAALGALLFAAAPPLVHAAETRPSGRLLAWGYGLLVAGAIALLLAQVVALVLSLQVNIL